MFRRDADDVGNKVKEVLVNDTSAFIHLVHVGIDPAKRGAGPLLQEGLVQFLEVARIPDVVLIEQGDEL